MGLHQEKASQVIQIMQKTRKKFQPLCKGDETDKAKQKDWWLLWEWFCMNGQISKRDSKACIVTK